MSTVEVEVLRKKAMEEEKEEIERIKEKFRERRKNRQKNKDSESADLEIQAIIRQAELQELREREQIRQKLKQKRQQQLQEQQKNTKNNQQKQQLIQQAQKQEKQEKEQIRQKLKQKRQQQLQEQQKNTINNQQKQQLIQQAQKQEKQEKEQIRQNLIQRREKTAAKDIGKEDIFRRALDREEVEKDNIWELYLVQKPKKSSERFNQLGQFETASELEIEKFEGETLKTEYLAGEAEEFETFEEPVGESIDRSALLEKFNIRDIQDDEVDHILENFDRSLSDENVEEIEEQLMEKIKKSALSHPKIEWVNVLVFLDEKEIQGNIKIFAEYNNGSLLNRIISAADNERLEMELMQIALYEVWDVFTTLGVNTDYLESKIMVEVELDRA
ncbi:MAG: hypothetical protein HVN35_00690 [Methanobacteriaceae archaeon]|nr:hypothetical protein [Methanobacteriaceae archaeon]